MQVKLTKTIVFGILYKILLFLRKPQKKKRDPPTAAREANENICIVQVLPHTLSVLKQTQQPTGCEPTKTFHKRCAVSSLVVLYTNLEYLYTVCILYVRISIYQCTRSGHQSPEVTNYCIRKAFHISSTQTSII